MFKSVKDGNFEAKIEKYEDFEIVLKNGFNGDPDDEY